MRYAIYFTPGPDTTLAAATARWLQYDIATGHRCEETFGGERPLQEDVAEASRYGFHGTLKAPFRLSSHQTEEALVTAFTDFCRRRPPAGNVALRLSTISNFFALVPDPSSSALAALSDDCVRHFEAFRAPLTTQERARRLTSPLSPREIQLLDLWGYPYVFDCFRFHLTLTGKLPEHRIAPVRNLLETALPADARTIAVDHASLCAQPDPNLPFKVLLRLPLQGTTDT